MNLQINNFSYKNFVIGHKRMLNKRSLEYLTECPEIDREIFHSIHNRSKVYKILIKRDESRI